CQVARGCCRLGCEVGVEQLRFEFAEERRKSSWIVASDFIQLGRGREIVTQGFRRLPQGKHAQFNATVAQFQDFADDERFRELRKNVDDVSNPIWRHVSPRLVVCLDWLFQAGVACNSFVTVSLRDTVCSRYSAAYRPSARSNS